MSKLTKSNKSVDQMVTEHRKKFNKYFDNLSLLQKSIIKTYFTKEKFFNSEVEHLFCPTFKKFQMEQLDKTFISKLLNKGFCHYNKDSGFLIQYVPNWFDIKG